MSCSISRVYTPTPYCSVGGTDLGLLKTKRHQPLPQLIATEGIPELRAFKASPEGLHVGAAVTLTDFEKALDEHWNPFSACFGFLVRGRLSTAQPLAGIFVTHLQLVI